MEMQEPLEGDAFHYYVRRMEGNQQKKKKDSVS